MSGFPPLEEIVTPEALAAMPADQRGAWEQLLEQREAGLVYRAELEERGEWEEALQLFGSEERAAALVRWSDRLDDDELRDLLARWWSTTEAWSGDPALREGMLGLLSRVGPLAVTSDEDGYLSSAEAYGYLLDLCDEADTLTVYRGNLGEDPRLGHSWSLDPETAERFARMASGARGRFLGMYREDGVPSVWRARVDPLFVLGYFDDRGEREVVLAPEALEDVEKIREAIPTTKED